MPILMTDKKGTFLQMKFRLGNSGVTITEVLIASAIFSMVALGSGASFTFWGKNRQKLEIHDNMTFVESNIIAAIAAPDTFANVSVGGNRTLLDLMKTTVPNNTFPIRQVNLVIPLGHGQAKINQTQLEVTAAFGDPSTRRVYIENNFNADLSKCTNCDSNNAAYSISMAIVPEAAGTIYKYGIRYSISTNPALMPTVVYSNQDGSNSSQLYVPRGVYADAMTIGRFNCNQPGEISLFKVDRLNHQVNCVRSVVPQTTIYPPAEYNVPYKFPKELKVVGVDSGFTEDLLVDFNYQSMAANAKCDPGYSLVSIDMNALESGNPSEDLLCTYQKMNASAPQFVAAADLVGSTGGISAQLCPYNYKVFLPNGFNSGGTSSVRYSLGSSTSKTCKTCDTCAEDTFPKVTAVIANGDTTNPMTAASFTSNNNYLRLDLKIQEGCGSQWQGQLSGVDYQCLIDTTKITLIRKPATLQRIGGGQ